MTTMIFEDTTEERYYEMLEVLPPAAYGTGGFLVGEPVNHQRCTISGKIAPTFDAYFSISGKFRRSCMPMTVLEFSKLTKDEVLKGNYIHDSPLF